MKSPIHEGYEYQGYFTVSIILHLMLRYGVLFGEETVMSSRQRDIKWWCWISISNPAYHSANYMSSKTLQFLLRFMSSTCPVLPHFAYSVTNFTIGVDVIKSENRGKTRHIFALRGVFIWYECFSVATVIFLLSITAMLGLLKLSSLQRIDIIY